LQAIRSWLGGWGKPHASVFSLSLVWRKVLLVYGQLSKEQSSAMPRVSVIIPTYNRCALVHQAIDSVLAQTYTDYESSIVDVWTVTAGAIKLNAPR
jgi:hypothetical protein